LNNGLDNWVQIADKLFESENVDSQTRTQYAELSEKFHNINKRHVYDKVAIINQMHDIASKVVCSDADKHDISELGHELTYAYLEFSNLQSEYNGSASAVNVALDKKMSGAIARVTRIHPMETMSDLTVL
jgi:hypothetical protein